MDDGRRNNHATEKHVVRIRKAAPAKFVKEEMSGYCFRLKADNRGDFVQQRAIPVGITEGRVGGD